MNKEALAAAYLKLHSQYEQQAFVRFKRALDTQVKQVITHIRENGVMLLSAMLPAIVKPEPMQEAYQQVYTTVGTAQAKYQLTLLAQAINPKKAFHLATEIKLLAFQSEFWRNLMLEFYTTYAGSKIQEVDTTTINRIKVLLAEAEKQNLSLLQTANFLEEKLSHPDYNKARAMVIARTESTVGANHANYLVSKEADYLTEKVWINVHDSRTRHSHAKMDSHVPVKPDENFEVPSPIGLGFEYALYPGGEGLSAGNVVNCRCSFAVRPVLDEDGLPILK